MARYTCPSCGRAYNGKKCRNCLYEHFTEEITHGGHVHTGEPLVIEVPRPVKRKDPFGCDKRTRKRRPMAGFVILLALINSCMPLLRNWGLKLDAMESRPAAVMKAEPVMAPEDMVVLHQEQGITIFADREDVVDFHDGLCLYVEYTGSLAYVTVVAGDIRVNGCDMPLSALVCKARRGGRIGKGWLELEEQDLKTNSIETFETLGFTLTALGSNGRTIFTTDEITLVAEGAA